uniref:Uncharacterized protein n=1 Tax=Theropithecus gelada TaxID=9565 RepID=A0A8D2G4U9_THEGE
MKDTGIKRLLYNHLLCVFSISLIIFIPSFFLENSSILEAHLIRLCICCVFLTAVTPVLYLVAKPNASSKRSLSSHKVTGFLKYGNIFICGYFVCFYYSTKFIFVRTKSQSMDKSFHWKGSYIHLGE